MSQKELEVQEPTPESRTPFEPHQERVAWLGEPACQDPDRVGGKAAALSRLRQAFDVPPGFCVPAGPEVFEDGHLTPIWRRRVAGASRRLGGSCGTPSPAVAVRSSALDEDGLRLSFAGQHASYLNVRGEAEVLAAVERCRASAFSPQVLAYRRGRGSPGAGPMAVLVQELVTAEVSVLAFSVDPITGDHGVVVLEAAWGLGESLVGGTVTPDRYLLGKRDLSLLERCIADKRSMSVVAARGTREVAVPRGVRLRPALSETAAVAVARLARDLEQKEGHPVDVECALRRDRLFVLQCRPVTAWGPGAGGGRKTAAAGGTAKEI